MDQGFSDFQVGAFQDDASVIDNVDIIDEVNKEEVVDDVVAENVDNVVDEHVDDFEDIQDIWDEPIFESVSVASVLWGGRDDWDRAIYKLSNGRTAYGSKGLGVDDVLFDYEEFRTSGGGYYGDPNGKIVGQIHTRNGESLILQRGEGESATFHQQMYAWGNQGPVMSSSTQDVSNQIGKIEESANSDIDGDGYIGVVEPDEAEVEVETPLYDDSDGDFDQSLYQMSDGTIVLAEQGLEKNDLPLESQELNGAKDSKLDFSKIVGITWANNGFSMVFNDQGAITQQLVKWGNRGPVLSGKLRAIKDKQVATLEERMGVDINLDSRIGEESSDDAFVEQVIWKNQGIDSDTGFDRSIYKLTDQTYVLAESGLDKGDLPFESDALIYDDKSVFDASAAVGITGTNNGFGVILKQDDAYKMQQFKWGNRGVKASGKLINVSKQIPRLEENNNVDFNGDEIIGKPFVVQEDPEVERVIFSGNEDYDRGIYQMKSGQTVFAEEDLEVGDTPFEEEPLVGKDGKSYAAGNVVGVASINDGFVLIEGVNGDYYMQGFKYGSRGPRQYGKSRKIKNVLKLEDKIGYDLTGEGQIGKEDPIIKSVLFNGDDESLYELNDGSLVISDPDVEIGDTPFDLDPLLSGGKNLYKAPDGIVGMVGINNGIGLVFNSGQGYRLQGFKQKGGKYQTIGKPKNISKKLEDYEIDLDLDLNKDNLVGSSDSRSGDDGKNPDMDEFIQDLGDGAADLL